MASAVRNRTGYMQFTSPSSRLPGSSSRGGAGVRGVGEEGDGAEREERGRGEGKGNEA